MKTAERMLLDRVTSLERMINEAYDKNDVVRIRLLKESIDRAITGAIKTKPDNFVALMDYHIMHINCKVGNLIITQLRKERGKQK